MGRFLAGVVLGMVSWAVLGVGELPSMLAAGACFVAGALFALLFAAETRRRGSMGDSAGGRRRLDELEASGGEGVRGIRNALELLEGVLSSLPAGAVERMGREVYDSLRKVVEERVPGLLAAKAALVRMLERMRPDEARRRRLELVRQMESSTDAELQAQHRKAIALLDQTLEGCTRLEQVVRTYDLRMEIIRRQVEAVALKLQLLKESEASCMGTADSCGGLDGELVSLLDTIDYLEKGLDGLNEKG